PQNLLITANKFNSKSLINNSYVGNNNKLVSYNIIIKQQYYHEQQQQEKKQKQENLDEPVTHFGFKTVPESLKDKLVGQVFTNVASKYDLMNDAMSLGIHRLWKDHFIREMAPGPGTKLLDVAGGTGDIAMGFLNYCKEIHGDTTAKVTVLDINSKMLESLINNSYVGNNNKLVSYNIIIKQQYYHEQQQQEKKQKQENLDEPVTHFGFKTVPESLKDKLVGQVFTNVASKYDLMNDAMSLGIHRLWKDHFIREMAPGPGTKLLDVAGGTGDIAMGFLNYCKEIHGDTTAKVTVLDINSKMLEVCKQRFSKIPHINQSQISFELGNAEKLSSIPSNSYDVYTIAFGIRNCTHIELVLSEAFRVLKPGGRFMCLEFGKVNNPIISTSSKVR
ncbi:11166_t:CDS:2, partial [Entrophospora sp. SA101]